VCPEFCGGSPAPACHGAGTEIERTAFVLQHHLMEKIDGNI
jgi:hypothetical protein